MKARSLGRFVAEFLEGFLESDQPAATSAQAPMVIPVEAIQATVKQAVHEMLDPILAEEAPSAEQLDFAFSQQPPSDETAEQMLYRLNQEKIMEAEARAADREQAMGRESDRPLQYDPNSPTAGRPWESAV